MRDDLKTKAQLIAELEELRAGFAISGTPSASEGRFKQMVDDLPQMVYELDRNHNVIYANTFALQTFGYTALDIQKGLSITQVIHPDDLERAAYNTGHVMQGQGSVGVEYLAIRSDGSTFPIKIYSRGVFDKGEPIGVRGTILDISEAKQTEEALKRSESYYRTLFENTGTALVNFGEDGVIRRCNSKFEILSGCSRGDIEGKLKWSDFVAPEDLARLQDLHAKRMMEGVASPREYEFIFLASGGVRKHVHIFIELIPGTEERVCSLIDSTERILAEEALRNSEELYELVVRGAYDGIWDWDLRTNVVYYSPRYKEILGYGDDEFPHVLDSWKNSVYPDDLARVTAAHMECMDGKVDQFEVEYRIRHKDGSLRWFLGRGTGVKDENGTVYRLAGSHTDITLRKLNERTTQAMYDISKAISTTTDLNHLYVNIHAILGKVIDATNFFIGLWDKEDDRFVFPYFADERDEFLDIRNVSDPNTKSLTIHVIRTGEPLLITQTEILAPEILDKIGLVGTPPAVWLGVPLKLKDNIIGAMAVQHYTNPQHYTQYDVSFMEAVSEQVALAIERKANEEALTQLNEELEHRVEKRTAELRDKAKELEVANRRLTELDEIKSALVSSVSHELRTPLTSIRGFAKLIGKDFQRFFQPLATGPALVEKGEQMRKNLGIIESEGERLTRLINDFLDINRIESGKATWNDSLINPCEVVAQAVNTLSGAFAAKKAVALRTDFPKTVQLLHADPDKIQQVAINLLNNACKFTQKGAVTVSIVNNIDTLTISVSDTGIGIPLAEQHHIFEKFHKTKTNDTLTIADKGTGLGLAICREIVKHYAGTIWVESEPGKGSIFSFTLPTVAGTEADCPRACLALNSHRAQGST